MSSSIISVSSNNHNTISETNNQNNSSKVQFFAQIIESIAVGLLLGGIGVGLHAVGLSTTYCVIGAVLSGVVYFTMKVALGRLRESRNNIGQQQPLIQSDNNFSRLTQQKRT